MVRPVDREVRLERLHPAEVRAAVAEAAVAEAAVAEAVMAEAPIARVPLRAELGLAGVTSARLELEVEFVPMVDFA